MNGLCRPVSAHPVTIVAVAVVGVLLLALSLPRLGAALSLLPAQSVLSGLQAWRTPTAESLKFLGQASERAALWHTTGRILSDGALASLLLLSLEPAVGGEREVRLAAVAAQLERSLARAPMNGYVWLRLAVTEAQRHAREKAAVRAMAMSYRVMPVEPRLAPTRLRLALTFWYWFDPIQQTAIRAELAQAKSDPNIAASVQDMIIQDMIGQNAWQPGLSPPSGRQ
ncbi:MAG: hypothetical protein WCK65_14650 [Rhodospirillaceae bacterium]